MKKFMVTYDTSTKGNIDIPSSLIHRDHEEADTIILLHASTIDSSAHLDIHASDTDILLQLVNQFTQIPRKTYFLGKSSIPLSIEAAHSLLGVKRSNAIIGFHVMTGCDENGKFAGRSKETCYKKFLEADDEILNGLASLGSGEAFPSIEVWSNLERFICRLYDSPLASIKELRWQLYSRKQAEGENLPPTVGALQEHVKRAHYLAMVYNRSLMSIQDLPPPDKYGWRFCEARYVYEPIMTQVPSAPSALINLVKCNCKKGCTKNCSCKKNILSCTEICGCTDYGCQNPYSLEQNVEGGKSPTLNLNSIDE